MIKIYALVGLNENDIKYIGQTKGTIEKRLKTHIQECFSRNNLKNCWIRGFVTKNGKLPNIILLDEVPKEEANFWEDHYIFLYKSWGFKLKNTLIGESYFEYLNRKNRIKVEDNISENKNIKRLTSTCKKIILEHLITKEQLKFDSIKQAGDFLKVRPDKVSAVLNQRKTKKVYKPTGSICIITKRSIKGYKVLLDNQ